MKALTHFFQDEMVFDSLSTSDYLYLLTTTNSDVELPVSVIILHIVRLSDITLLPPVYFILPKEILTSHIHLSFVSTSSCILWSSDLVSCFLFSVNHNTFSAINLSLSETPSLIVTRLSSAHSQGKLHDAHLT